MKKRSFVKSEDGVVAVFVALTMVVLLSFTAFVTDYGMVYYKKSQLQTAVDAAALAAVYVLPNEIAATQEAHRVLIKNGFSTEGVTVTLHNDGSQVRVSSPRQADTYFANLFGISHLDYACSAQAKADIKTAGGAFDYLLFQGSQTATLTMGGRFWIYGSVHSNGHLSASPSVGYIMGAAQARLTAYVNPWTCQAGSVVSGAPFVPMVDFGPVVERVIPTNHTEVLTAAEVNARWWFQTFNGNVKIVGNTSISNRCAVNGNLYVEGNLTINGGAPVCTLNGGSIFATGTITFNNSFSGNGCVFANGSLIFNGNNNTITPNQPIAFYSKNGNINFNTASTEVHGLVYAPNGDAKIVGGTTTFYGSIIANTVSGIPARLTMREINVDLPFVIGSRTAVLVE